jgi:ribosomal protein S18 acetylase RimI-like enzyme
MKLQIFGIPTNRYAPPLYEKTLQKSGPKYEVRVLFFLSEAVGRLDESSAGFSRAKRIEAYRGGANNNVALARLARKVKACAEPDISLKSTSFRRF